ncbi:MAG: CAP domain-containing protein [Patescibacteria group bacterium]
MSLTKKILLIIIIALIAAKAVLMATIFLYPKILPEDGLPVTASQLIEMTNNYRQENGLNPLSVNYRLTQAAVNKARDILTNQSFSHTSPDGRKFSQWIKEVNYKYFYVGENLAIDFNDPEDIFAAWLDSPSHKDNIIKPQYQEIGLAVLPGKFQNHSTIVVVQLFGTRVLGEGETNQEAPAPLNNLFNGFSETAGWQKFISLPNLEKINYWLNFALVGVLGVYLVTYRPKKSKAASTKQPIISRYQANAFREWRERY